MTMLGAALRAELVDALGLARLRKELRGEYRELAREIQSLRAIVERALAHKGSGREGSPGSSDGAVSAERIRAARQLLGESRRAFAARLGVSPGIVFAWESGRSAPRRKAIIIRLQRLLATQAAHSKACPEADGQAADGLEAAGSVHGPIAKPLGHTEGHSEKGQGGPRIRCRHQARQDATANLAATAAPTGSPRDRAGIGT